MVGLLKSDALVAEKAGLQVSAVVALRNGVWDEPVARSVAKVLSLNADALVALAEGRSVPPGIEVTGLAGFSTPFGDMLVNSYLVWDATVGEAVAFDTGADCSAMLDFLTAQRLKLKALFLTHTHGDHVFELDRLCAKTGATAFVNALEPLDGCELFPTGREWSVGALQIGSRLTWGHSKGGTTYVVRGLERPVAVVGDALFAASVGGGKVSYVDALRTNREEILSLPKETVLCPGHGPLTTVAWESQWNAFLA